MKHDTEVSEGQCEAHSVSLLINLTLILYKIFWEKRHNFQVKSSGDLLCLHHLEVT
jgi:hypothetical protein